MTASECALMPASKGGKLDGIQPFQRGIDASQVEMGVGVGVAVAGEVLQRGEHAALVRAADVRGYHGRDLGRIFTVGTRVDDRVLRINLHIGNWVEVPVDAQCARFLSHNLCELLDILRIVCAPKAMGCGKAPIEVRRMEGPRSKSTEKMRGTLECGLPGEGNWWSSRPPAGSDAREGSNGPLVTSRTDVPRRDDICGCR